ncbi:MAG: MraY family glycosyltransferase [Caldisericaceae bacterium]
MREIYSFVVKHGVEIELFFLGGFFLSSFFTPISILIGKRFNIIDKPKTAEGREKIHSNPTPRTGGIAIFATLIIVSLVIHSLSKQIIGIISGATIIFVGMLFDDKKGLSVKAKFLIQTIAALVVVASGIKFTSATNPISGSVLNFGWVGIIFTIIWIVGITNAINIIDGLDGLASGVATISLLFLSTIAMFKGHLSLSLLLISISGALVAFLIYNFHPARIFLGDSGAELLGYLLAVISIVGAYKTATLISVAVPLLALAIPIGEVMTSIVRRVLHKSSPFRYDEDHFHYFLLKRGWSQRAIAILYYSVTFALSMLGLFVAFGAR